MIKSLARRMACVRTGAKYVVSEEGKVYQIANQHAASVMKNAGESVSVTGNVEDDTITVSKMMVMKHWLWPERRSFVKLGCIYGTLLAVSVTTFSSLALSSESSSETGNTIGTGSPRPVLLELFTSEGCSSCPPADRLLERLDRSQPVAGARIIVLSEHVDYWNRLGWTDPFSSALFTHRQQDYVARLHLEDAYTPQLVVDGQKEMVGSDERAIRDAILKAETHPKLAIEVKAQRAGTAADLEVEAHGAGRGAGVYIALAEDNAQSQVTRGENAGHNLTHVAVVRNLLQVGKTDQRGAFAKHLTMPLNDPNTRTWRVVVFLQDSDSKVLGANETRL